eukprot:scaffold294_cov131-Isochrysis_galbana.AAC.10
MKFKIGWGHGDACGVWSAFDREAPRASRHMCTHSSTPINLTPHHTDDTVRVLVRLVDVHRSSFFHPPRECEPEAGAGGGGLITSSFQASRCGSGATTHNYSNHNHNEDERGNAHAHTHQQSTLLDTANPALHMPVPWQRLALAAASGPRNQQAISGSPRATPAPPQYRASVHRQSAVFGAPCWCRPVQAGTLAYLHYTCVRLAP